MCTHHVSYTHYMYIPAISMLSASAIRIWPSTVYCSEVGRSAFNATRWSCWRQRSVRAFGAQQVNPEKGGQHFKNPASGFEINT